MHRSLAGRHPVDVAAQRIDLAVMRDHPVGMRQRPGRERVGGEALMHQRQRALEIRFVQVGIVLVELVGEEHALVDHGAAQDEDEFERRLYILRKSISQAIYQRRDRGLAGYYPVSFSCRTVIYKGMFLADQLGKYYPDLHEPDFESALALVHQRFSTNTFPTWSLAHPYRMIAHNGQVGKV